MASQTDILNLAIQIFTGLPVSSIYDDTPEAQSLKICYDMVRQSCLQQHVWNFAKVQKSIGALSEPPPFGFSYQCPKPVNCLRVVRVIDQELWENASTEDGVSVILVNEAPAKIVYILDLQDASRFSPLFVRFLACSLALQVARVQTDSSAATIARISEELREVEFKARQINALEDPPEPLEDGTWNEARW